MAVKIVKETLAQQVQDGWKKDKLAEFYGLPVVQMGAALKQAGLKIRKFHAPKFELVDEVEDEGTDVSSETLEVEEEVTVQAPRVESVSPAVAPEQASW